MRSLYTLSLKAYSAIRKPEDLPAKVACRLVPRALGAARVSARDPNRRFLTYTALRILFLWTIPSQHPPFRGCWDFFLAARLEVSRARKGARK